MTFRSMTIYQAKGTRGREGNAEYPNPVTVRKLADLREAVAWDHVGAAYKRSHRSNKNFLYSDCLLMDVDNAPGKNEPNDTPPEEWKDIEQIRADLPGVCFYAAASRNHMKPKDGRPARPKWHIYFPIEKITDGAKYKAIKTDLQGLYPYFDKDATDRARFFYGNDTAAVQYVVGPLTIVDYILQARADGRIKPKTTMEAPAPARGSFEALDAVSSGSGLYDLREVLAAIDPAQLDYSDWVNVGMILHKYQGPPYYFTADDWDAWSRRDAARYKPTDCRRRWNGFRNDEGGVGARRLIDLAKVQGWAPPARRAALKYRPAGRDLTDAGNAELFARLCRDRLRWCDALGWLHWTGKVWELDDHAAGRLALDFSAAMLREATEHYSRETVDKEQAPEAKAYLNHAIKLRSTAAQLNMLALAKARMAIRAAELDADPEILNTLGGIVNLRTGDVTPHDPQQFCTMLAPIASSSEGAQLWDDFLNLVTCDDRDLKAYLRRVAGMTIVGKVYTEGMQITIGGGRNGKSTFYGALSKVLGEYAGSIDADVLIVKRHESRFELTPLRGKRLVLCGELEIGQRLSTKALKRLTSTDPLNIERKYRDPERIHPTHHVIMHTNVLPLIGDARDNGTWCRLTVIPFNAVMPTGKKNIKAYDDILVKNSGGAILQWMIDGAREYLAAGGSLDDIIPEAVRAATAQYRANEDWLQPFLNECCVFDSGQAQAVELYSEYQAFASMRGDRYIRKGREFYDALGEAFKARGLVCKKPANKVTWYGVRVIHAYTAPSVRQDFGAELEPDDAPLS